MPPHIREMPETHVRGNVQALQQVLANVLRNAREAVNEGGNIWIDVSVEGERIVMRVRDDGRGIAPDMIGRIFDPLVTTKRGQGGTGLGLATTRRLLDAAHRNTRHQTKPQAGTQFFIFLPPPNPR